jgi:DNA-binding NarL/FixJ family response regulator
VAATGQAALDLARQCFFDVTFVDIQLSDMRWIDLSECLKELHPDMEVLLITGYAWRGDLILPLAEIATTRLARSKLRTGTDWEEFSQNEP